MLQGPHVELGRWGHRVASRFDHGALIEHKLSRRGAKEAVALVTHRRVGPRLRVTYWFPPNPPRTTRRQAVLTMDYLKGALDGPMTLRCDAGGESS
ncbi:MAG: hypothetical protein QF464_24715, partial [Myxococcota bacterium]|nr:hypothetical protein [Myxococcota bacterium]